MKPNLKNRPNRLIGIRTLIQKNSISPSRESDIIKPPQQTTGKARVITRFGAEVLVRTEQQQLLRCTARRKFEHIACGDYVMWQADAQNNAHIKQLLPRKNTLSRPDRRGRAKAIAANIDQLFIVTAWLPKPSWSLVDRYIIAAAKLDISAIIVINKQDLAAHHATADDQRALAEYTQIAYPILPTQANASSHITETEVHGIDLIHQYLQGKTSIFVGQSGVGKSSIIGQILPERHIRTGTISATGEGRHTTTTADLYELNAHTAVIDSPGVRDFLLADLQVDDIVQGYREFTAFAGQCRFHNCRHQHEPHCAVKQAVQQQQLPALRYQRYLTQLAAYK
ncbi:MAG TPA: ribosome small subunit-dependent GTPase A [Thiothrix sp.]|nr:ribosome small subunit-dependent GTPase A [Thiothrix sp.]